LAYEIYGIDIDEETESNLIADFLTLTKKEFKLNYFAEFKKPKNKLALILCNPPFSGYGKKLGSEV
jgi:16S rRNA G1207 methylase RsmC